MIKCGDLTSFNPRTREGAKVIVREDLVEGGKVSIHAPVKVRRQSVQRSGSPESVSIHAPVKVRSSLVATRSRGETFQSTHP